MADLQLQRVSGPSAVSGLRSVGLDSANRLSFQSALQHWLQVGQRPQRRSEQLSANDLLTMNPNLNLKLQQQVQQWHAETQEAFQAIQPAGTVNAVQQQLPAIRALSGLGQTDTQQLSDFRHPKGPLVEHHLDQPFGKVVAPTALSAALMGQGTAVAQTHLVPESLKHLLRGLDQLGPIEKKPRVHPLRNDYSHWQQGVA
ncbi:MAG: hypothetical protein IGS03_17320 [Candidatus Sericytochromatia bacterium]|nr:hypothetical protein [Candidatus Sericytochromatia bacterium]